MSTQQLTFAYVPMSASGISVGQLAKRIGVAIEHIWIPLRPNSRTMDVAEGAGVCIVQKKAFQPTLARLKFAASTSGSSNNNTNSDSNSVFTVLNQVSAENMPSASPSTNGPSPSSNSLVPAMISNRLSMIRAMRGIGDGRKMQLQFRFIPPQFVCFIQSMPNSRVVVGKASKDGAGGGVDDEDPAYCAVLIRSDVSRADLIKEGCIYDDESRQQQDGNEHQSQHPSLGEKRPRDEKEASVAPPAAVAASAAAERKKPSALTKLMQTAEGAFLSDAVGVRTHSALWAEVKASIASNGLHKPPLHRSKLFYPHGTNAMLLSNSHTSNNMSSRNATSANTTVTNTRRVVVRGIPWHMLEPHCLSTSFNFTNPADLLHLSTTKICAIVIDGSGFLNCHRYFRCTARAVGDLMSSLPAAATAAAEVGAAGAEDNEEGKDDAAADRATMANSNASAMSLATHYESMLKRVQALATNVSMVVGGGFGPAAAEGTQRTTAAVEAAFEARREAFQRRIKEASLLGYRVVLFASAPSLHHADEQSIADKLTSLASCVQALMSKTKVAGMRGDTASGGGASITADGMPPVTLLVSVASSSASWAATTQQQPSNQSTTNAKLLWRAFVRHLNQNKFPLASESIVVVGGKKISGAEELFEGSGGGAKQQTHSDNVSDLASIVSGGGVSAASFLAAASSSSSSSLITPNTAFLSSYDDALFARQCVGEDGSVCRAVSANAFFEGRAFKGVGGAKEAVAAQ